MVNSGHMEWCEPTLCATSHGAHVSHAITGDHGLIMFLAMYPGDTPRLLVGSDQIDGALNDGDAAPPMRIEIPVHLVRGFLLSVAKLAGLISWDPATQAQYTTDLVAAYRGTRGS